MDNALERGNCVRPGDTKARSGEHVHKYHWTMLSAAGGCGRHGAACFGLLTMIFSADGPGLLLATDYYCYKQLMRGMRSFCTSDGITRGSDGGLGVGYRVLPQRDGWGMRG